MMFRKAKVLTIAEKCKNILASNWQGSLNTIKANASGSKQEIHSSMVKYLMRKGRPYIWVPEQDLHNTNTVVDDRASFAVAHPFPGSLGSLLKSMKRLPARVALAGEVSALSDAKVSSTMDNLQQVITSEQESFLGSSYAVSGILSSSTFGNTSRSENLLEILDTDKSYMIYKLSISSCMFIDGNGVSHEVNLEELRKTKADNLSSFATKLIDGINQSQVRRRALVIFCYVHMNTHAKDAYMLSVDHKGFDVLAQVVNSGGEPEWKEFRFSLKEEAQDAESFCTQLVEMEEDALKSVKSFSGL